MDVFAAGRRSDGRPIRPISGGVGVARLAGRDAPKVGGHKQALGSHGVRDALLALPSVGLSRLPREALHLCNHLVYERGSDVQRRALGYRESLSLEAFPRSRPATPRASDAWRSRYAPRSWRASPTGSA